jgi:hypothetical protein
MAQVFISYSSKHKDLTRRLVSVLEKEGYAVWWDHELESWGPYQVQIDKALAAASVVVVIWSEGAAASTYVKAEAIKALSARKLVNARAPDFPLSALPTPFNALHIDNLDLPEPHNLLRSIRSVWVGGVFESPKPLHETYQESFGVSLFDPKRTSLDREVVGFAPSELLQARHEAVPYIDATGIMAEIVAWCRDGSRTTAGRLVYGPGGLGKTRLMIEIAKRLRADHWLAGFLQPPRRRHDIQEMRQREQALEQVFALGDEPGVLFVVDYVEGRQDEVELLARLLRDRSRQCVRPVRIVLLARGDQWWQDFYQQTAGVAPVFGAQGRSLGNVQPIHPIEAGEARLDFFVKTAEAFAPFMAAPAQADGFSGWNGELPSEARLTRLMTEPAYARPLAIQIEAMLFLASAAPDTESQGIDALLGAVLGLEKAHWRKLLGGLSERRIRDISRGMAQVTALQGVDSAASVDRLLMADGFYGNRTTRESVDPVRRDMSRVYGGPGNGIVQLEPDLVGEHLVASTGDNELIDGCMCWIGGEPEADRHKRRVAILTVLQRATQPEHGALSRSANKLLVGLLEMYHHNVDFMGDAAAVAVTTPGSLVGVIEYMSPLFSRAVLERVVNVAKGKLDALVAADLRREEFRNAMRLIKAC